VIAKSVVGRFDALVGEELVGKPVAGNDAIRAQQQERE
jgi:hypothetical protein